MRYDADTSWHLDKKVPLGLLIMIIVQTMTLVYVGTSWKSDIDNRIVQLEKSDASSSANGNRLTVLETQYTFIQSSLSRILENQDRVREVLEKKDAKQ